MTEQDDPTRAGTRHPAFRPKPGDKPPEPPELNAAELAEVQWLRELVGARAHRIAGGDWVRQVLGTGPDVALAQVLEQVAELHDLALSAEKWWRDQKGVLRCEVRADIGAALECLRAIVQLSAIKRDKDYLGKEDRRWAAMTPEERAEETLRDPVHGPLIRALVLSQQKDEP